MCLINKSHIPLCKCLQLTVFRWNFLNEKYTTIEKDCLRRCVNSEVKKKKEVYETAKSRITMTRKKTRSSEELTSNLLERISWSKLKIPRKLHKCHTPMESPLALR